MPEQRLKERFEKLNWTQQLGNLASTLARISTRASHPKYDDLVVSLLREAALFIEWSAPHAPDNLLLELASTQREVLAWKRVWPVEGARQLLMLFARNRSDHLLQTARLVKPS
jgi:hypothetical protein